MAIYFLEDSITRMIKIGKSNSVRERKNQLQNEKQTPLTLLGVLPVHAYAEWLSHKRFAEYARGGEWFAPCEAIYIYILENAIDSLPTAGDKATITELIESRLEEMKYPHIGLVRTITKLMARPAGADTNIADAIPSGKFGHADKKLIQFTKNLQMELEAERVARALANQRLADLQAANPDITALRQEHRILTDQLAVIVRERDRLKKANDYLANRHMKIAQENNLLREYVLPSPVISSEAA